MTGLRRVLLASIIAVWAAPAFAQAVTPAEPGAAAEDCRAEPVPEGEDAAEAPPGDLTATLDKCDGVLQPPPTGDGEIGEPPPQGGETPVIPPGALPEQPTPDQG